MKGFIYVAGPYRGKTATAHNWTVYSDIDANINEARRWAIKLAGDGIPYFCPHLNSAHFEVITPEVPPNYWLEMDLEILRHAWGILLVPGWRESSGSRTELDFARDKGLNRYTHNLYDDLVREWREYNGQETTA